MLFEAQARVMRKSLGIRTERAHKILDFALCVAATERIHAAGDIEFVNLTLHLIPPSEALRSARKNRALSQSTQEDSFVKVKG